LCPVEGANICTVIEPNPVADPTEAIHEFDLAASSSRDSRHIDCGHNTLVSLEF